MLLLDLLLIPLARIALISFEVSFSYDMSVLTAIVHFKDCENEKLIIGVVVCCGHFSLIDVFC